MMYEIVQGCSLSYIRLERGLEVEEDLSQAVPSENESGSIVPHTGGVVWLI
jgi:hypothetical protein